MTRTPPPLNIIKATQKACAARYNDPEILCFSEWLPKIRLPDFKKKGVKVETCTRNDTLYIRLTWAGQIPLVYKAEDFLAEYKDTYLAAFGLNCQCPFEENAGVC